MTKRLRWTPLQREIEALYSQGMTFAELIEQGYSNTTVSKVTAALKRGDFPRVKKNPSAQKSSSSPTPAAHPVATTIKVVETRTPETRVRDRVVEAVPIGSLLIIPEDTYISQHGWYLLHDTYKLSQQQFGYTGTMGEFIVDLCQLFRDLVSFPQVPFVYEEPIKEVISDGGEPADNGSGLPSEGGGEGDEGGFEDDDDDA
ncbi:MAG: hypothetical protein R6V51_02835 [Dehalococcoidia bacterium]